MLLSIEPKSEVPLYLQLRSQIVEALVRGELAEGDPLPSVRQLARDLGINLHTVNKAYQVLEDEGYVNIQGRKGVRIAAQPSYTKDYLVHLETQLASLWVEAQSKDVSAELFVHTVENALKGA